MQSFGFKYGIPPESDLVFDVRFLPNPYYEMSLRERNGTIRRCAIMCSAAVRRMC